MCVGVLFTCMSMHHVCAWCPHKSEEGVRSLCRNWNYDCDPTCGASNGTSVLCMSMHCSSPVAHLPRPLFTFVSTTPGRTGKWVCSVSTIWNSQIIHKILRKNRTFFSISTKLAYSKWNAYYLYLKTPQFFVTP